ncbi:hypothetical protein AAFC00_004095 [Neodothiora populina]
MTRRRERAAIAAQACQTCRSRKSKCDEQRPKCGLCRRLGADCVYREPQPTKKDKTMVHILETLQRLENKFDTLQVSSSPTPPLYQNHPTNSEARSSNGGETLGASRIGSSTGRSISRALTQTFPKELQRSYQHLTVAHKVLLWPAIYLHILNSGLAAATDLEHVLQDGTPWFIHLELAKHPNTLAWDTQMRTYPIQQVQGRGMRVGFTELTMDRVQRLANAYFNTFNLLLPILDQEQFMEDVVGSVMRNGFADGDPSACLALLVFALGQVAIDGVYGEPVSSYNGSASGLRGGTADEPPGIDLFNEARRRVGFSVHACTLENVQILLLQAAYYEACARHMDFWRATVAASMSCQVLIRCESIDWSTPRADLIKRAYWTCVLSEDMYHLELDLSQTGIHTLEDQVPLPYFHEAQNMSGNESDERSHFQYHFLAMIALRRLITRIHSSIHDTSSATAESTEDYGGPPVHVIKELARQLESWRSLLPRPLQWSDSDKFDFPVTTLVTRRSPDTFFVLDQGPVPINHRSNLDIITAQLRTRFYYARFMIYRPFVYKALHFPELMSPDDVTCCALAIQSACLWPIAMAPPKNKKRLVPHLFTWTQNFMGILLILRMTTENTCLKGICDERVNREDLEQTASLMLDWLRDIKQVDGIAEWSWKILSPLYLAQS